MSSGANIGDGDGPPTGKNGLGDAPTNMGALEKLQLGWLNFELASAGKNSEHKLGPRRRDHEAGAGRDRPAAGPAA